MIGLLPDMNFEGQFNRLLQIMKGPTWNPFWIDVLPRLETFRSLSLAREANDRLVIETCQREGLLLVTANRNNEGPDSLEAALGELGPDSLPVISVGNADRILGDSGFAEAAAVGLLEILQDFQARPERVLGTRRLYVPKQNVR